MAAQRKRPEGIATELFRGAILLLGIATAIGAYTSWQHGNWGFVIVLAVAAACCAPFILRWVLGEAFGYTALALRILSLPALLFPRLNSRRDRPVRGAGRPIR